MNYAFTGAICQFARVFHVRDLICAYASVKHASEAFKAPASVSEPGRVQGHGPCCPRGMSEASRLERSPRGLSEASRLERSPRGLSEASRLERSPRGLSERWGSAVGGVLPPSSTHEERALAKRSFPLNRVRKHASCARNAHAYGRSTYLMITVPVDTILIINDLQRFLSKMVCHFVLF